MSKYGTVSLVASHFWRTRQVIRYPEIANHRRPQILQDTCSRKGNTNQRRHHRVLTSYEAAQPKVVSVNYLLIKDANNSDESPNSTYLFGNFSDPTLNFY